MKHKDYQKVIEIFQVAVNLTPKEKAAFLRKKCGQDAELRRRVEQLLEAGTSQPLNDPPPVSEVAVNPDADEPENEPTRQIPPQDQSDRRFGNYKIIYKIGEGGMGEVYLAHDLSLDRRVALKILPEKLTHRPEYLQRFRQEARAASALNHPYILTIFEFGQNADGVYFIASEFVEGQTLNKFCADNDIELPKKLDILIKLASALAAAHEAGIIHRDIKPDNVIVRPDGYIKVLDFGLAKLIENYTTVETDPEASTHHWIATDPGMIMGTASYMSPEQAKGSDIDARSDIFSFGVVFYEMISGRLPFKGNSAMEMIAAILHEEPHSLNDAKIPREIKRIIDKSLKKDRDERYQTMKDLLLDLKEIRRELEFQHKLEQSLQPDGEEAKTRIHDNLTTAKTPAAKTGRNTVRFFSGKPLAYPQIALLLLFVAIAGGAVWWLAGGRLNRPMTPDSVSPGSLKTSQITNWANSAGELATTASFSGDGKFIAYSSTEAGTAGIWVKQTGAGDPIQITKDEFYNRYPVWSPNGEEVVYYSKRGDSRGLRRVALTGGQQKLITEQIDNESKPRFWSRSGKIYFQGNYNLFAADENSGEVTQITDFPSSGTPVSIIRISPDESRILFLTMDNGGWQIRVKPLGGEAPAAELIDSNEPIENVIWHPDGQKILFSRKTDEFYQIFSTDLGGSDPVQISSAAGDCFVQDVSADGARILFSSLTETSDLWKIDTSDAREQLAAAQIDAELWADVSPDNKAVVYQSIRNLRQGGNLLNGAIVMQPVARDAAPLKIAENGFLPQWSADGETIAFLKLAGQNFEIWRVSGTGDRLERIFADGVEGMIYSVSPYLRSQVKHLSWSPHDAVLAFPATREGLTNIWSVSADGSNERMLSANQDRNQYLYCPVWTSDGTGIAFGSQTKKRDAAGKQKYYIWFQNLAAGGDGQQKVLETEDAVRLLGWSEHNDELIFAVKKKDRTFTLTPPEVPVRAVSLKTGAERDLTVLKDAYFYNIYLSPDKRSVAFSSRSSGNDDIWLSPLTGGEPRKLTANNDPRLFYSNLAWAADGKSIYFGKQTRFTLLSMFINPKITEKNNEKSNE